MKIITLVITLICITSCSINTHENMGVVTKIVDGDTVYFKKLNKNIKCRVAFIDTPESKRNSRAKKFAKKCKGVTLDNIVKAGKKASQYTSSYLKLGISYPIDIIDVDRYKRSICIISDFNEDIVKDGYAVPYFDYIPEKDFFKWKNYYKEAKQKNTGLWKNYKSVMNCLTK